MTTPTLALGISAAGAQQVADLANAVAALKTNLQGLGQGAAGSLSGLEALTREFREMRQELTQTMQGIRTDLAAGFKQAFERAAMEAKTGSERVESEVKKGAARIKVAGESIDLGAGLKASVSGTGLASKEAVAQAVADIKGGTDAITAAYERSIVQLDKAVANVMKAATQGPNTMRGTGYIKWWDAAISDIEKGEAALRAKLAKEATSMDQAVAQFRARQEAAFASTVRGQVGGAMGSAGIFSSITSGSYGELKNVPKEAEAATGAIKTLKGELNEAHSAARGLASGFGAMWLTWGQIAPLLAGAALSHSFTQTIKMGAEVQHTMEVIRNISDETEHSVGVLNAQLLELARSGPFGPREVAEAMKTLSLAGLEAKDVSSAIKDVLNFAVAGTTSIANAADVLTSVSTAFKISAQGYNYVGDVIAKTAAISKSSVESIGSAFKTASVINSQYGASLEDVGVGLALLANVGIQGTAAGTALRNMYVDIMGRTPKVQKSLVELGLAADFAFDKATGKARPLVAIFTDLEGALAKFNKTGQTKALQDIFSERGGKEAIAVLDALRTKAKDTRTSVANELAGMLKEVENAAGFTAVAAANMALTPLNQMKSVVATLQASLVEAFGKIEPSVVSMSQRLKELFNSDAFKGALAGLITAMADFVSLLVSLAPLITAVVAAYVVYKVAALAGAIATTALQKAVDLYARSTTVATAETLELAGAQRIQMAAAGGAAAANINKASTLATIVSVGSRLTGWLAAVITAWEMYSYFTGKASKSNQDYSGDNHKALMMALSKEAERLENLNDAKRTGITLDEQMTRSAILASQSSINAPVIAARSKLEQLRAVRGTGNGPEDQAFDRQIQAQQVEVDRQETLAMSNRRELQKALERVQNAASIRKDQEQAARAQAAKEAAEEQARIRNGMAAKDYTSPGRTAKDHLEPVGYDNEMSSLTSVLKSRESALQNAYDREMALLERKHKGELISEGTYQALVLERTAAFQGDERGQIITALAALDKAYEDDSTRLKESRLDGDQLDQRLKNLKQTYDRLRESIVSTSSKLESDAMQKQQNAAIELDAEVKKITKSNDEYWIKAKAAEQKDIDLAAAREKLSGATEMERAAAEASIKVRDKHSAHTELLQIEYVKAQKALEDFATEMENAGDPTGALVDRFMALQAKVEALAKALQAGQTNLQQLEAQAGNAAAKEVQTKQAKEISKGLTDIITDAIFNGGKNGGTKLKEWLKSYFLREPLKMIINAIVNPIGQIVGGVVNAVVGGALGGAAGGGGALSMINTGSTAYNMAGAAGSLYTVGSQYMAGTMSGANAAGTVYANATGGGLDALFATNSAYGTAAGIGGGAGGFAAGAGGAATSADIAAATAAGADGFAAGGAAAGSAGAAAGTSWIPVVGWVIAAAALLYAVFGQKPGAPKISGASPYYTGGIHDTPNAGANAAATSIAQGLQQQYEIMAQALGGQSLFKYGVGYNMDPGGTAHAVLQMTATSKLNGFNGATPALHNTASTLDDFSTQTDAGRGSEAMQQAVAQMSKMMLIRGLQDSDIGGTIGNWLRSLGNLGQYTEKELDGVIERLRKIMTEKAALQDQVWAFTHTAAEAVAKTRQAELAALDESNRSLATRVYALQDERRLQDASSDFMRRLNTTDLGGLSKEEQLQNARTTFQSTLVEARKGDPNALQNLSSFGEQLLEAQRNFAPVGAQMQETLDYVKNSIKYFQAAGYTYVDPAPLPSAFGGGTAVASAFGGPTAQAIVPQFASGGEHSGGWRWVGEDGPELEFTGPSRILDARTSKRILTNNSGDRRNADIASLREEMRQLNTTMRSYAQQDLELGEQLVRSSMSQREARLLQTTKARSSK